MNTKKLKGVVFAWNPNAFGGKGYWFMLGKNGGFGRAASKKEMGYLNRPANSTVEPKEITEEKQKETSEKTQSSLENLKNKFSVKNLKNIFKSPTKKLEENLSKEKNQSDVLGKSKESVITPQKIGNIETALYATVAPKQIVPIKRREGVANVASKLLGLFNKIREEKKLQRELNKNFEEEIESEEKRRHRKLMRIISKAKKTDKEPKLKKEDSIDSVKELKKISQSKQPTTKITPGTKTVIPKTSTKLDKVISSEVTSTASKVATGVALAATTSAAIGGAESGGNYDISFGDKLVKGKLVNANGQKTPEEFSGKKLTEMTLQEVKAFGEYRGPNGAVGKYQFMPTTLFGGLYKGKPVPGLVQKLGYDMNTPFSPTVQDKLQELLHSQDVATLKRLGVPITPGYEYMAHYIGAGGAAAVYESIKKGEDKTVAQIMIEKGYPVGNNPKLKDPIEGRAINFEALLQSRLESRGGLVTPHSSSSNVGETIKKISTENTDLKNSGSTVAINNSQKTTQIGSKPNPRVLLADPKQDYPTFMEY
jgi:hypothetical protein